MNRRSPSDAGLHLETQADALGSAARWTLADGGELYRLSTNDTAIAERLLELGSAGVGGFADGGIDDDGPWLLRRGGAALHEVLREKPGPWPFAEAMAVIKSLATALAACEGARLFPGPLGSKLVIRDGDRWVFVAPTLVGALLSASPSETARTHTAEALWTPPEQASGALWDNAANRYVLGLIAYRVLTGEHPFAGAGLRHALGEAAARGAPPFEESVARALPPGLQALVLRLLDPHAGRRPQTARFVVSELSTLSAASGDRADPLSTNETPALAPSKRAQPARRAEPAKPRAVARAEAAPRTKRPTVAALLPIVLGLAVAAVAYAAIPEAPTVAPSTAAARAVPPTPPLREADTQATDCASCHPRQAAEWRRSIMAHSVRSPLFNGLEILVQEQVGRSDDCPNGAGILRRADPRTACRNRTSGVAITGSGGEHWCTNCHSPMENRTRDLEPWEGLSRGDPKTRLPVKDLLDERALEGISCGFCHMVHGPVGRSGSRGYTGNPTWVSFVTGRVFEARPEDRRGLVGIANSAYDLRPETLLLGRASGGASPNEPLVHARPEAETKRYLRSSEMCGACHDVRLFGSDVLGARQGEHFKRLRNAYSEWATWADDERRAGRTPASCQDCHMSAFPGVCEPDPGASAEARAGCPEGTRFVSKAPGELVRASVATSSSDVDDVTTHYLSGVDLPLALEFPDDLVDEPSIDQNGVPLSSRTRRDLLLRAAMRFDIGAAGRRGGRVEIPIEIENTGAGHRVPAGFSQERELWVHLVLRDANGRVLYEVGRVDRASDDLRDKVFERVTTRAARVDAQGRPEGMFGADVRDGPDVPRWSPPPELGGRSFRGKGLVSFQNGFLRCVRCIGVIGADGTCEALPGQTGRRADRFEDGDYDIDTGECRSNLFGRAALFETYFPVGSLDASRGLFKAPDAIIDTRSLPPGVPIRYVYDLDAGRGGGPLTVEARLLFRAFPPYLIRAFADYEREQARRGQRPSGPLVTDEMLRRIEVVELASRRVTVP